MRHSSLRQYLHVLCVHRVQNFLVGGDHDDDDDDSNETQPELGTMYSATGTSQLEDDWQSMAYDYKLRFCGHCNTTTDIKEANFFGR